MSSIVEKVKDKALEKLSGIEKPSCDLTGVSVKDVSRKNVVMASKLSIKNPYDHDLPIVTVTYKLLSANRELGNGQITDPGDIKANDNTQVELPVSVAYDFLWNLVKDIGSDWDIDYRLEVGVEFKLPIIGKHTLPLHHSGTLKLPTLSDIF